MRAYKSDVTEFFREALTNKDGGTIPTVDIADPTSIEDQEGGL